MRYICVIILLLLAFSLLPSIVSAEFYEDGYNLNDFKLSDLQPSDGSYVNFRFSINYNIPVTSTPTYGYTYEIEYFRIQIGEDDGNGNFGAVWDTAIIDSVEDGLFWGKNNNIYNCGVSTGLDDVNKNNPIPFRVRFEAYNYDGDLVAEDEKVLSVSSLFSDTSLNDEEHWYDNQLFPILIIVIVILTIAIVLVSYLVNKSKQPPLPPQNYQYPPPPGYVPPPPPPPEA